jgi:hypothetical protein
MIIITDKKFEKVKKIIKFKKSLNQLHYFILPLVIVL